MTYKQLQTHINSMTEAQLDDDATITVLVGNSFEVTPLCDFVNPKSLASDNDQDYREAVYLDEIEDSVLDKGHCYMTVII